MNKRTAAAVAVLVLWGCGGSVVEGGAAGSAGGAGVGGTPGAGGATGHGGASTGGTSNGGASTGGAAGAGGSSGVSCEAICNKLAQSGCSDSSCVKGCTEGRAEAIQAGCGAQFEAMVTCLMGATLSCDSQGNLNAPGCEDALTAYGMCLNPPPDACAGMPYPVGGTQCSGTVDPSGTCAFDCKDANGHSWSSQCSGGTCKCAYEGQGMCACQGTCDKPCCPGM